MQGTGAVVELGRDCAISTTEMHASATMSGMKRRYEGIIAVFSRHVSE